MHSLFFKNDLFVFFITFMQEQRRRDASIDAKTAVTGMVESLEDDRFLCDFCR